MLYASLWAFDHSTTLQDKLSFFYQQQRLVYNVHIGLALGTRQTSLWCTAVLETTGTKNVKDTWVGPHY